jgi:hypothetical protein
VDDLPPQKSNALQAAIGLIALGIVLSGVCGYKLNEMRKLGDISKNPEPITLDKLTARGPDGNPHVLVTEFGFGEKYIVWSEAPTGGSPQGGMWKHSWIPIHSSSGFALVKVNASEAGSDIQMSRWAAQKSMLHGLVINKIDKLGQMEIELLKENYPRADFDRVLLIEADRSAPSSFWGLGLAASIALVLVGGLILFLFFGPKLRSKRKPKRRRRRREEEEDEEDETEE